MQPRRRRSNYEIKDCISSIDCYLETKGSTKFWYKKKHWFSRIDFLEDLNARQNPSRWKTDKNGIDGIQPCVTNLIYQKWRSRTCQVTGKMTSKFVVMKWKVQKFIYTSSQFSVGDFKSAIQQPLLWAISSVDINKSRCHWYQSQGVYWSFSILY